VLVAAAIPGEFAADADRTAKLRAEMRGRRGPLSIIDRGEGC